MTLQEAFGWDKKTSDKVERLCGILINSKKLAGILKLQ